MHFEAAFLTEFLCNFTACFLQKYRVYYTQDLKRNEVIKMFYWFIFTDGYEVCTKGLSKQELKAEERKHGKLIAKERA